MSKQKYRELLPDELEALQIFAAEFGKKWKEKLSMVYWYNARVYRDKSGKEYPVLHRMRNEFGPSWLDDYKLEHEQVNKYVQSVAKKVAKLDYAQRGKILREVIQNMNERAEQGDMQEIAAFLVAQLGGDADEVVEGHLPVKRHRRSACNIAVRQGHDHQKHRRIEMRYPVR